METTLFQPDIMSLNEPLDPVTLQARQASILDTLKAMLLREGMTLPVQERDIALWLVANVVGGKPPPKLFGYELIFHADAWLELQNISAAGSSSTK